MPERPDLDYVVPIVEEAFAGRTVKQVTVHNPIVLRVAVRGDFAGLLEDCKVQSVTRHAHFVRFDLDKYELIVSPMLAGVFALHQKPSDRVRADTMISIGFDQGPQLRFRDNKQMGKVYLIERGAWDKVPGLQDIGVDVLSPEFTFELFEALARKRRDQVRVFLMDKKALDAMGNAYADEVLWRAQIHPKTFVRKLTDQQLKALHAAIVAVLSESLEEISKRKPPIDKKLRDFVKVRNRHGEPCPRCQKKIRRAGVRGYDAYFCPACQPDGRGSSIVDWRKV